MRPTEVLRWNPRHHHKNSPPKVAGRSQIWSSYVALLKLCDTHAMLCVSYSADLPAHRVIRQNKMHHFERIDKLSSSIEVDNTPTYSK